MYRRDHALAPVPRHSANVIENSPNILLHRVRKKTETLELPPKIAYYRVSRKNNAG